MKHLLGSISLTREEIISAVGKFTKNTKKKSSIEKVAEEIDRNYLYAVDQRRIRRRLKGNERFILSRYFEGYRPRRIAQMMGVSEESVRSRLRRRDVFGSQCRPGRPKLHQTQSSTPSYLLSHVCGSVHSNLEGTVSLDPPPLRSDSDHE